MTVDKVRGASVGLMTFKGRGMTLIVIGADGVSGGAMFFSASEVAMVSADEAESRRRRTGREIRPAAQHSAGTARPPAGRDPDRHQPATVTAAAVRPTFAQQRAAPEFIAPFICAVKLCWASRCPS